MQHKAESHINKILIRDELIFEMDVGNGWRVTDIWFDSDVPPEKIDCLKVKFERVERSERCKKIEQDGWVTVTEIQIPPTETSEDE